MVGNMLSRVLPSRLKVAQESLLEESLSEKLDYQQPQNTDITISEPTSVSLMTTTETRPSRIAFADNVKTQPQIKSQATPVSSRKHSYASIKEDSEIPQSFTARRLQPKPESPETCTDAVRQEVTYYTVENESAIFDDDTSDAISLVCSNSTSNESVLSAARPQSASLETMPDEILDLIFSLVTLDHSKDRYVDPKVDLFSCLFVSRAVHFPALRVLYRHVKIPQSKAFFKFSQSLIEDAALGPLVQSLDFSHYSSIGFGRARSTNQQTPYLTPATLGACLDRSTSLKAFLVHEHVDDELDTSVMTKLLTMPSLRALDLCSCSSKAFTQAFTAACANIGPSSDMTSSAYLKIERLSLHECTTLRPQVFQTLLPKLERLTHLDVAHTMIDDKSLMSIPKTARITHLNLERCTQITGRTVVEFLTQHPAVKDSIVYLNLMADASRYRLLDEDEVTQLLPALPNTLRSLNIGGARVNSSHTQCLRALATHLEELGLKGASLSLSADVTQILSMVLPTAENEPTHPDWTSSLRYVDLTDVKSVSKMSLHYSPTSVIGPESLPLEVIELGQATLQDLDKSAKKLKNPDWIVRELGRRGWYVRQTSLLSAGLHTPDDGYRKWKMGARWWGMRKIPVYEQETGGMYGYFMFKRS